MVSPVGGDSLRGYGSIGSQRTNQVHTYTTCIEVWHLEQYL